MSTPKIKTAITEMLGIDYPIICGAMMWLGRPKLCKVVADSGGIGSLTAAIYKTEEEFREAVIEAKRLCDGYPFIVGVTILPAVDVSTEHHKMYLRVCAEENVAAIEVGGSPIDVACGKEYIDMLKAADVKLFHKVGALRHAVRCEAAGYDGIYAAGFEEGGHPLSDDVSTMVLTPKCAEKLNIPVVTVGGIADGKSMAAALSLGAEGVMMATRFLGTTDCCEIHDDFRQDFLQRQEFETEIIARNIGLQCRALKNGVVKEINKVEASNGGLKEMMPYMTGERQRVAWESGDLDHGVMTLGQTVGRIDDIPTTRELVHRMMSECQDALQSNLNKFQPSYA